MLLLEETNLRWGLQAVQVGAADGATLCWLSGAQALGLPGQSRGTSLLQKLLGEAQLGRQEGHVADGETQGLDLGQSLAGWHH